MKLDKLKNIKLFSKDKYIITKNIIAIVASLAIATLLVVIKPIKIWDRLPIFAFVIWFPMIHLIFKVKDIYEFIYKKRFVIAALFMVYVTVMGYSGSSVATYREIIQGEYQEKNYQTVFGDYRSIRSDEWCVNLPIYMSQALDNENPYGYFNDNLRGTNTDMSTIGNAPVLDISIIGKPLNIGYLILGPERGLSFSWYGKLTLLVLVSFEFCMMITNKKKLISLAGMLLLTFSAATQWWYATEYFIWGMLALVLFDKFMLAKNMKVKILCTLGLFISGLSYIFIFYPAWQLTFGYIYLAVAIWIIIKNRKEYKFKWIDLLLCLIVLVLIGAMVGRFFVKSSDALTTTLNTDYPGERFEIGGGQNAEKIVFSYVYSFLFPYVEMNNPCEFSGMISFYPIPMILALIFIIKGIKNKDKKTFAFIIPMLAVSILFSVWTFFKTNETLARITFLYMVPATRMAVTLGVSQVLLLIYMMANIDKNTVLIKNDKIRNILIILLNVFIVYMAYKTDNENITHNFKIFLCGIINFISIYEIFNMDKEKNLNTLIGILIVTAIVTGTTVNPIQKGLSVLTEKPVSKEIQKIVKEDSENNLWVVDDTNFYIPNYVLANGARVINSTNIYPNMELYKTILGEEEANKKETKLIYNRYAHVNLEIAKENKVELLYSDSIKIYITTEKLKELAVRYILSTRDNLDEFNTENEKYEKIYDEYGLYIYKLNY